MVSRKELVRLILVCGIAGAVVGAVSGTLLGTLAPSVTSALYSFDDAPPPSFNPVRFAAGCGIAWGLMFGGGLGLLLSLGAWFWGRLPRLRLRAMIIAVALAALALALLVEAVRR